MKISIIGYGKMGHAIADMARARDMQVASIIDPADPDATHKSVTEQSMEGVDVAIDFTSPNAVIGNIEKVASMGKAMVVGTTGWYSDMDRAKAAIKKYGSGFVYSPNFSIGINLFFRMVKDAAIIMDKFQQYDPFVYEMHHRQKIDAPGATAKLLGDIIVKNIGRKKRMAFDRINDRKIDPEELHVASIRAGYLPGTHVVGFDGEADTIELKHTARSRSGFAEGTLVAAKWIKDRKGFYTLDDIISEVAGE